MELSEFLMIFVPLTLSKRRSLLYRNQSADLLCKSKDWLLYDRDLRHERVNDAGKFQNSNKEIYHKELVLKLEHSGSHTSFLDSDITMVKYHLK